MASGISASCTQGDLLCFLDLASPGWRNASLANLESLLPIWSIKRAAPPLQVAQVQSHAGTLFGGSFKPSSYLLRSNPALRHPSARLDREFLQSTTPPPSILAPLRLFDKAVPVSTLHSKPARTRVETLVAHSFSSPSQVKFGG
jgi:hypothetical protein